MNETSGNKEKSHLDIGKQHRKSPLIIDYTARTVFNLYLCALFL